MWSTRLLHVGVTWISRDNLILIGSPVVFFRWDPYWCIQTAVSPRAVDHRKARCRQQLRTWSLYSRERDHWTNHGQDQKTGKEGLLVHSITYQDISLSCCLFLSFLVLGYCPKSHGRGNIIKVRCKVHSPIQEPLNCFRIQHEVNNPSSFRAIRALIASQSTFEI